MWTPDQALVSAAQAQVDELLTVVDAGRSDLLALLDACGTLSYAGWREIDRSHPRLGAAAACLAAEPLDFLDEAATAFNDALEQLRTLPPSEAGGAEIAILESLRTRTRVQLWGEGARIAAGRWEWGSEQQVPLAAFDGVVEASLFDLLRLGEARTAECLWVEPARRPEFWWFSRHSDLPSWAFDAPAVAAVLLERFPREARERMEQATTAEIYLDRFRPRPLIVRELEATVVPITSIGRARRVERASAHRLARGPWSLPLRAAADGGESQAIHVGDEARAIYEDARVRLVSWNEQVADGNLVGLELVVDDALAGQLAADGAVRIVGRGVPPAYRSESPVGGVWRALVAARETFSVECPALGFELEVPIEGGAS